MTDAERSCALYAFARCVSVRDGMGIVYTPFSLALDAITLISQQSPYSPFRIDLFHETEEMAKAWMNANGL